MIVQPRHTSQNSSAVVNFASLRKELSAMGCVQASNLPYSSGSLSSSHRDGQLETGKKGTCFIIAMLDGSVSKTPSPNVRSSSGTLQVYLPSVAELILAFVLENSHWSSRASSNKAINFLQRQYSWFCDWNWTVWNNIVGRSWDKGMKTKERFVLPSTTKPRASRWSGKGHMEESSICRRRLIWPFN